MPSVVCATRLRQLRAGVLVFATLGLLMGALPRPATASPLTVVLGGVWALVDDAGAVLGGAVTPGTPFSVTLVYDDATPDSNASPLYGNYFVAPAQFSFTLATGGFLFSHIAAGVSEIDVTNLGSADSVAVYAETFDVSPSLPPLGLAYANPLLDDPTATALSSDALTGVPRTLSAWSSAAMSFFADIDDGNPLTYFDLEGDVTELAAVPEPGTFVLLSLGLAMLGRGARCQS